MANTISDTDFQPGDEVLPHEGSRFHRSGHVGDMTETDKEEYGVNARFLLDEIHEGYKAPFARQDNAPQRGGLLYQKPPP